ncbi:MAG TPA: AAA family ATPase [Oscillatoriales cyanobacterium M59_W2019_021]|nr:MAG: hypothetical protein D6728_05515 [Cyanobacteria bacterium J055]HIK31296.1 AAA family ATPase [Oscillatoriales cyanobacterium M4454_W2019_049]HIK51846.1 AAA family ATPase [Oscillatoriales cyanobacterium M59_W2019_021]
MKTIAIYHNKGGVGKTTTAVNLAAAFKNKERKVLLVDIDAQANATFATGLIKFQFEEDDDLKEKNVLQLISSGDFDCIPDIVRQSKDFNTPEIDVIPSHIRLIDEQQQLTRFSSSRLRLNTKLQQVEDDYDIVVIDAPHRKKNRLDRRIADGYSSGGATFFKKLIQDSIAHLSKR